MREYYSLPFSDDEGQKAEDLLVQYINDTGDVPVVTFERSEESGERYVVAIFASEA